MMSGGGASMELDFFGMEKRSAGNSSSSSSQSQYQKLLQQKNNTTNGAISKINPQLLKTVIDGKSTENFPPLPVYNNPIRNGCESSAPGLVSSPLTIFYNGKVCVFDMPHDKAEMIMKIAEEGAVPRKAAPPPAAVVQSVDPKLSPASTSSSMETKALLEKLNGGDLPIARKKSLQRFLEKRKERGKSFEQNCRLVTVSPYANGSESADKKMKE